MPLENLSIKEIVRKVKSELVQAEHEMVENDEQPLFRVKKLSVELNFIVDESKETGGGLDLKIVAADARKNYHEGEVQKITLEWESLSPSLPFKIDNKGKYLLKDIKYDPSTGSLLGLPGSTFLRPDNSGRFKMTGAGKAKKITLKK